MANQKHGRGRPLTGDKYDHLLIEVAKSVCSKDATARKACIRVAAHFSTEISWKRLYNLYCRRRRELEMTVMEGLSGTPTRELREARARSGSVFVQDWWREVVEFVELELEKNPALESHRDEALARVPIHRWRASELSRLIEKAGLEFKPQI